MSFLHVNRVNYKMRSKSCFNGKQGTFVSDVQYFERSMFSFIAVLLNFRKYLSNVLFSRIVMSFFNGFILFLSQVLNCLNAGSRFCYFCSNLSTIVFVFERQII